MTFKAILGAALVSALISLSATATSEIPGWIMSGSKPTEYEMGVAPGGGQNRGPAGYLKAKQGSVQGFGTMMQKFAADNYRDKRVRLSAMVKSQDVNGWAGLWMRVDGQPGETLAFDNMQKRSIKGTTGWQRHEVVLDVPSQARWIAMGVLLNDGGTVWLDNVKFEAVPQSVPVTSEPAIAPAEGPKNLEFTAR